MIDICGLKKGGSGRRGEGEEEGDLGKENCVLSSERSLTSPICPLHRG